MRTLATAAAAVTLLAVVICGAACQSAPATDRMPSATITPFLMFQDGRAEEAINRYIEVFGEGRIVFLQRFGPNPVGAPEESIQHAAFEIHGQAIMATESPIRHVFDFTPAISLFVDFDSVEELDRVFAALSEGGEVMMPLGDYGFSRRFAFIQDRYGVSWQLNLPHPPGEHAGVQIPGERGTSEPARRE